MDVRTVEVITSVLALVAVTGSVLLLATVTVPPLRRAVGDLVPVLRRAALFLAFLVAAGATAGSLYFSEVANFEPCRWCWFQRVFMYPLSVILLVAVVRAEVTVRRYVIPLATIGAAISTYHYLIEWYPTLESDSCSFTGPICSQFYFREFGFVTLAFMALCGFVSIIILTAVATGPETASGLDDGNLMPDHPTADPLES